MTTTEDLERTLNAIRSEFPSVPVLCIPWLHLKHPAHVVQHLLLTGASSPAAPDSAPLSAAAGIARTLGRSRSHAVRAAFCLGNGLRLALKLFFLRWSIRTEVAELMRNRFDVIAKTWCFGPEPATAAENDFYYGDLQKRLTVHGVRTLLLCGDANATEWQNFARKSVSAERDFRLPELALCPPMAPVRVALQQLRDSGALRKKSAGTGDSLMARAAKQASLDCLDPGVTQDSLFFDIVRCAVRQWKPRAFVTLYEGHGWEKTAWWAVKTEDRSCQTVGYQHTALFSDAVSVIRPFVDVRDRSLPDIVLSLGEPTAQLMAAGHQPYGTRLVPFGTFRRQGSHPASRSADPALRTVLVLPEGIASEADVLFRFAYECARAMPQYRFVLRGHPQWPAPRALERIPPSMQQATNVEVSTIKAIEADFERASIALYRGSSAALYAILNGLLAVNLQLPEMINSDPLYQLEGWRKVCATPAQFCGLTDTFERELAASRDGEWRRAADYVNRYLLPVSDSGIDAFLEAAGVQKADSCTA